MKKLCNKRALALALALVLVLSVAGGLIPASAAEEEMIAIVAKVPTDWTAPYAWVWDGDGNTAFPGWPGGAMEKLSDGWYYVYVPAGHTGVIISNNGRPQTVDGAMTGDKNAWITVGAAGADGKYALSVSYEKQNTANIPPYGGEEEKVTYTYKIHYANPDNWDAVSVYGFGSGGEVFGGWCGTDITNNKNALNPTWYDATAEFEAYASSTPSLTLVINNGGNGLQTADIPLVMPEGKTSAEFWITGNDADNVTTTAPEGWVTASSNPDPTEPAPTEPAPAPILISDCVQVKIGEKLYDMNVVAGAREVTVDAAGTAVVIVNGEETEITCEVEAANSILQLKNDVLKVVTPALVAIPGGHSALGLNIADWSTDTPAMSYIGNGWYTYTFNFDALASDMEYEFKITIGNTWDNQINDGAGNNIKLTVPAGSTSLTIMVDLNNNAVYNSVEMPKLGDVVSIIGQVRGEDNTWAPEAKGWEFTQVCDNLYVYEMHLAAGTYEYKCVTNYANWYEKEGIGNRVVTVDDETHVVFLYDSESGYLYDSVNNTQTVADLLGHMGPDSDPNNATTGDSFPIIVLGSMLLLAAAGASVMVLNRKRWVEA